MRITPAEAKIACSPVGGLAAFTGGREGASGSVLQAMLLSVESPAALKRVDAETKYVAVIAADAESKLRYVRVDRAHLGKISIGRRQHLNPKTLLISGIVLPRQSCRRLHLR